MNGECSHCFIGLLNSDNTRLVTLDELKEHIQETKRLNKYLDKHYKELTFKELSLKDYADWRTSGDLTRFKFCPVCGRKINWAEIRRSE